MRYEREVPDMSVVHHWRVFLFWGGGWVTEIRLHDLFFLANKEAWMLLKGCLVLPGSRECAFQQADRVKHVRRHEWAARGDIMTVTGSKMLTWALGIKLDTCSALNFINNPWYDIYLNLSVDSQVVMKLFKAFWNISMKTFSILFFNHVGKKPS